MAAGLAALRNLIWPRMGLRRYGVYLARRLVRIPATPHSIGAGLAAGAAVSVFPIFGVHVALGVAIAFLTRGSLIAAAIGATLNNPITFPFLFAASYRLGSLIVGGAHADPGLIADLHAALHGGTLLASLGELWPAVETVMVGALPIALAVYAVIYVAGRWSVGRMKAARSARLSAVREGR